MTPRHRPLKDVFRDPLLRSLLWNPRTGSLQLLLSSPKEGGDPVVWVCAPQPRARSDAEGFWATRWSEIPLQSLDEWAEDMWILWDRGPVHPEEAELRRIMRSQVK